MTIGIVDEPTAVPITPIDIARLRISGLYLKLEQNYNYKTVYEIAWTLG